MSALNYSPADAAADLARYKRSKRSVSLQTGVVVGVAAILVASRAPIFALSLGIGGLCGVVSMLATLWGSERLLDGQRLAVFVLSSFLRLCLFAIIPVALAVRGPWYTMVFYFAGFFTPLMLYALRTSKRKS